MPAPSLARRRCRLHAAQPLASPVLTTCPIPCPHPKGPAFLPRVLIPLPQVVASLTHLWEPGLQLPWARTPPSHTTPKCGHANYLKTCLSSVPLCLCLPLPLLFQNHLKLLQTLRGLKALPPNRSVSLRDRSTRLHLKISHNFQLSLLAPACGNAQIVPKCLS